MHHQPRVALATLAALLLTPATYGVTLDYPLDTLPTGFGFQPSVTAESEGLAVTVSPFGFPEGDVAVHTTGGPGESDLMGARSVNTSRESGVFGRAPVRFDFSLPVVAIDFAYYDQGGDDDGDVILSAYSHQGGLVDTFTESYGTAFGGSSGLLEFPTGIDFIVAETTGGNAHSLGWSIRSVTAVPEPSALPLLIVASIATPLAFRRKPQA